MRPILSILIVVQLFSCTKDEPKQVINDTLNPITASISYNIRNGSIYAGDEIIQPKGVNALNAFGISKDEKMNEWKVSIVREFIGNLREQPISGGAIKDAQGKFLHSLDSMVIENRKNHRITILCPFGWVDTNGAQTLFTGKNPDETAFYEDYKIKLKSIANFFKGQEDVWIQIWNEPYHFNNENGYSHDRWLSDCLTMIENLRSVSGFTNIVVVPGNEQGQGEAALLEKGEIILNNYGNILFDLHAYGKWHDNTDLESLCERLSLLQQKQIPILFGEVGVITEGAPLSDPNNFLNACNKLSIGALAWLWNRNTQDQNSLLTNEGEPNDNNNNNWGSTFKAFLNND